MPQRHISMKPTFQNDLRALQQDAARIIGKMYELAADPLPNGRSRKQLANQEGLYRLRVGNYRVLYRFDDSWLSLLAIRRRNERTYAQLPGDPVIERPPEVLTEAPEAPEESRGTGWRRPTFTLLPPPTGQDAPEASTPLPEPLTQPLLEALGVPRAHWLNLLRCRTEDELMNATVPADSVDRVMEYLYPRTVEEIDQQPDLVLPPHDDLIRFAKGDLVSFLLRLDADQLRLTQWALKGPTMVKGGAGTGKSTVALHRVKALLERSGATGTEKVLFTTYTNALLAATRQLLQQLLTPEQLARVEVSTCDQVAVGVVRSHRSIRGIENGTASRKRLAALRKNHSPGGGAFESRLRARALDQLSDEYLLEEFEWIIDGRGLSTLQEYLEAPRPGRGLALNARAREAVWELYQAFDADTAIERFPAIRREALARVQANPALARYDHVLVDEAQDLSPVALALMAELCRSAEGLFFAADNKQSLYSRSYSWRSAHPRLQFQGRTAVLRRNYRSTREIDRAAFAVLEAGEGEELTPSDSLHEGPKAVLLRDIEPEQQARWIVHFIRSMARHLRLKPSAAAVLAPTPRAGEELAEQLRAAGLQCQFFKGRELDLESDVVRVLTLHSAKGLEFPIVVVAGLGSRQWPVPEDFEEPALFIERARHERRLLYVGLTRAMRGLMLVVPKGCRHPALVDIDTRHWHIGNTP